MRAWVCPSVEGFHGTMYMGFGRDKDVVCLWAMCDFCCSGVNLEEEVCKFFFEFRLYLSLLLRIFCFGCCHRGV